jgi:hypothetical protein
VVIVQAFKVDGVGILGQDVLGARCIGRSKMAAKV